MNLMKYKKGLYYEFLARSGHIWRVLWPVHQPAWFIIETTKWTEIQFGIYDLHYKQQDQFRFSSSSPNITHTFSHEAQIKLRRFFQKQLIVQNISNNKINTDIKGLKLLLKTVHGEHLAKLI
jgi:hypothetical protein